VVKCLEAFQVFDLDGNETIEIHELKLALEEMGHKPQE
jgi:Ca2+-binding EF-hand superfamily protein